MTDVFDNGQIEVLFESTAATMNNALLEITFESTPKPEGGGGSFFGCPFKDPFGERFG